jgi:hypothetical protein
MREMLRPGVGRPTAVTPAWPAGAARPDAYRFGVVGHAGQAGELRRDWTAGAARALASSRQGTGKEERPCVPS